MIPHIIHYCWFGGEPLTPLAERCIESWRKYAEGYQIKQWDESNFDLDSCSYVREAYKCRKWAFVSDYARFKILFEEGGVYLDTDVELIKPIGSVIDRGEFMACDTCYYYKCDHMLSIGNKRNGIGLSVSTGLGMSFRKGSPMLKAIIDHYQGRSFIIDKDYYDKTTVVSLVTNLMIIEGFNPFDFSPQIIRGITIYPTGVFSATDIVTGESCASDNTVAVHHGAASWVDKNEREINIIRRKFKGRGKVVYIIGCILLAPIQLCFLCKQYGFIKTAKSFCIRFKTGINVGII